MNTLRFCKKRILTAAVFILLFVVPVFLVYDSDLCGKKVLAVYCLGIGLAGLSLCLTWKPSEKWMRLYSRALLLISPFITFFCVEFVNYNHILKNVHNNLGENSWLAKIMNVVIYFIIYLVLYAISNRVWFTVIFSNVFCLGFAILNQILLDFRGTPITPDDFMALHTALGVAGQYTFFVTARILAVLLAGAWLCTLAVHATWHEESSRKRWAITLVLLLVTGGISYTMVFTEVLADHDLKAYHWKQKKSYKRFGTALGFVLNLPEMIIREPAGYSEEAVEQLGVQYEAEQENSLSREDMPNIIAIMNESYSDLDVYGDLQTDEEYMSFYDSLKENTVKGNLIVPTYGAGTAKTEFEFLTGYSCGLLPSTSMPYQNYIKKSTPSLATTLKNMGYSAIAMHPEDGGNWNRDVVYPYLGFQRFDALDAFEDKEMIRGYLSDASDYKHLIKVFEEEKAQGKTFLFNVTIQNHGGYLMEGFDSTVHITNMKKDYPKAEQFMSLMKKSDQALEELIAYLETVEEPTVLVMFGDHQPKVEGRLHRRLMKKAGYSSDEREACDYTSAFLIWANYDIEEEEGVEISSNFLSTKLMDVIGMKKPPFYSYLSRLMEQYPVFSPYVVKDGEGENRDVKKFFDERSDDLLNQYRLFQYNGLFGENCKDEVYINK